MTKKTSIGRPWPPGQSGNLNGRPLHGLAIAELARSEVERRELVAKLGAIAAGKNSQAVRACELLLAYAFGRPRAEVALEHSGAVGQAPELARVRAVILGVVEGLPEALRVEVARRLMALSNDRPAGCEPADGRSRGFPPAASE